MYRLSPKSSALAAIPANWAAVVPKLAKNSPSMMKNVSRTPKRSRMRSVRPLPVTAPIRAAISCTSASPRVIQSRIHRKE